MKHRTSVFRRILPLFVGILLIAGGVTVFAANRGEEGLLVDVFSLLATLVGTVFIAVELKSNRVVTCCDMLINLNNYFHENASTMAVYEALERDAAGQLPHEGYLYFFITAGEGARCMPSGDMRARVRYSAASPTTVVDDFNDASPAGEGLGRGYALTFASVADDDDGMKLLGTPAMWEGDAPGRLLFQYDPYEASVPFLSHMDGYAYYFFPPSDSAGVGTPPRNFDRVTFTACYS